MSSGKPFRIYVLLSLDLDPVVYWQCFAMPGCLYAKLEFWPHNYLGLGWVCPIEFRTTVSEVMFLSRLYGQVGVLSLSPIIDDRGMQDP